MVITFEVVSNCTGIIEHVMKKESGYVYEREPLCVVRTQEGKLVEITSQFSGYLKSVKAALGQKVTPETVLVRLEEKFSRLATSSD
ncbi:MAG: biotin/lipoyl-containing protein [Clostridia bacterium]